MSEIAKPGAADESVPKGLTAEDLRLGRKDAQTATLPESPIPLPPVPCTCGGAHAGAVVARVRSVSSGLVESGTGTTSWRPVA